MQFCGACGVRIRGQRGNCPLCGGTLAGHGEEAREVFPPLPPVMGAGVRLAGLLVRAAAQKPRPKKSIMSLR